MSKDRLNNSGAGKALSQESFSTVQANPNQQLRSRQGRRASIRVKSINRLIITRASPIMSRGASTQSRHLMILFFRQTITIIKIRPYPMHKTCQRLIKDMFQEMEEIPFFHLLTLILQAQRKTICRKTAVFSAKNECN